MDPSEQAAITAAIDAVTKLRKAIAKKRERQQIRAKPDVDQIKAAGQTWFRSLRPLLDARAADLRVSDSDTQFRKLLDCADRATMREQYLGLLKSLREELMAMRARGLALPLPKLTGALQPPPDFARLLKDPVLLQILVRRWKETQLCINAGADLAATVMMGGLLEGVFLARIHAMPSQAPAHKAKASPKNSAGQTKPLSDWTLNDYLEVAHELGWIGTPTRDVSAVIRDYRNLIHPQKEQAEKIALTSQDCLMFWSVFAAVTAEVINSI